MKILLFFLLFGFGFWRSCEDEPVEMAAPSQAPLLVSNGIDFKIQIQPILEQRCSPCHFPGGKLYEKLPFDEPKTIVGHPEGILKRFDDEKEKALLTQFIEEAGE